MQEPNVIATLSATGSALAERAFTFGHNRERYRMPAHDDKSFSRKTTLSSERSSQDMTLRDHDDDDDEHEHRLQLTFDKPPKTAKDGFVFGWGSDCDIQLVDRDNPQYTNPRRVAVVSERHFSITFDPQRRVIVRDRSTNGTAVTYDGEGGATRSHFTWIIFPGYKTIEISIPSAKIFFDIRLGKHEEHSEEFNANIDGVFPLSSRMGEGQLAVPVQQLHMRSQSTSVATSGGAIPDCRAIYLKHEQIGRGAYGVVYRVSNVSTGEECAARYIDPSDLDYVREIAIMKELDHVRSPPRNLAVVHKAAPIAFEEIAAILQQALRAVIYLNSRGFIHRDIKPANILVSSRSPLVIKLADLGLAKHDRDGQSQFISFAGTDEYAAPEMHEENRQPYTFAVDIWSLGMVALELAYGLPYSGRVFKPTEWFRNLFDFIDTLDSDILINFSGEQFAVL
nr:calcium/calmodulin-dependent protein kinase type ii delta 1 chain [Quercus suber]